MSHQSFIVTVTADNFAAQVLETSHQVPVLVDFWAAWCAPCKMLLPVLTRLVEAYQDKFILAKLNTDEQQALAAQFAIRGIPALKLFRFGQVVEEMTGVQPEQALRAMLDKYVEHPADKICHAALQYHQAGNSAQALAMLEQALQEEPSYVPLHQQLLQVLIDSGQLKAATKAYTKMPANVQADSQISALKAKLDLACQVQDAPNLCVLEQQVAANPQDLAIRQQLAARYVMAQNYQSALEQYLEIMRQDRKFDQEAGKKGLLSVFALLNNQGTLVSHFRAKMSSLLF